MQESVLSIGWVVGPVVGGYAAQLAGFGAPFFITAALAFTCYPALCVLMPRGMCMCPYVPGSLLLHVASSRKLLAAYNACSSRTLRCRKLCIIVS